MLGKITECLSNIVRSLGSKNRITESNIRQTVEEIKNALVDADVNLSVVRRLVSQITETAIGQRIVQTVNPGQQFVKIIHDRIVTLLGEQQSGINLKGPDTLSVILIIGLQGSGKTTSAAKLAYKLRREGRSVMLVPADLARPAAREQLITLAALAGVEIFTGKASKPETVVRNAIREAPGKQFNTIIVDTAGRMQADEELMEELLRVSKACRPDETLLAIDSMTGQNAVQVAREFDDKVNITGVLLNKFDSDTRGGAALSIKSVVGKPVKYIGVGEKIEQLDVFYPDRIASRILGMGDIVSLVEKAREVVDVKQARKLEKKMSGKSFTLEDYLEQFSSLRKIGSVESLMEMVPGLADSKDIDLSALNDRKFKSDEAIILSMTLEERRNHRIIGLPRRRRIARGSGTSIVAVNRLLRNFERSRIMMRKLTKNKAMQSRFADSLININ